MSLLLRNKISVGPTAIHCCACGTAHMKSMSIRTCKGNEKGLERPSSALPKRCREGRSGDNPGELEPEALFLFRLAGTGRLGQREEHDLFAGHGAEVVVQTHSCVPTTQPRRRLSRRSRNPAAK